MAQDENQAAEQLIDAVKDVAAAIRETGARTAQALKEIDETLALIASRSVDDGAPVPTAGELLEKVSTLGAKAFMSKLQEWEKKSGIFA